MKKIIATVLTFYMVFEVSVCGNNTDNIHYTKVFMNNNFALVIKAK